MRVDSDDRQPLDPAVLKAWRARNVAIGAAAGLVAVAADLIIHAAADSGGGQQTWAPPWPAGVAGAAVLAVALGIALWHAPAAYRRWWVRFDDEGVELERGILIRTRTSMPFFRLQHLDTHEGPFDRLFGLTGLVLFTAAPSEKAEIPGIDRDDIDAIRRHVIERAGSLDSV